MVTKEAFIGTVKDLTHIKIAISNEELTKLLKGEFIIIANHNYVIEIESFTVHKPKV